jgi:signal transduction histidine kinase/DNA-binding response OmpR family regulator
MSDTVGSSRSQSVDRELDVSPGDERERLHVLLRRLYVGTTAFVAVVTTGALVLAAGLVSRGDVELGVFLASAGIGALMALLSAVAFARWYVRPLVRGVEGAFQELETTQRDALASARRKDDFMAELSAEIRTPMGGLLGMIELLLGEKMEPKQLRRMKTLKVSAKALMRVVNDMLDFSKIDAKTLALRPRATNPVEIVWQVVELFRAQAELQGLNIGMEVEGSPPGFVRLDPDRLKQVLSTLVENALKNTERGRVKVRVEASPLGPGRTELAIHVTDTGVGIAAESRPLLFDAFPRSEGSLARRRDGTGLGLALSHEIVSLMGGELRAASQVGEGSVFTVKIPCDAEEDHDSALPASARPAPVSDRIRLKGRGRVLVAEDSPVNREVMSDFLSELECDADFVSNGLEAVAAVAHRPYDAILMDCEMPELDGYDATRRIHAMPLERCIPIVAVTAHAFEEEQDRARRAGMDAFLSKPVKLTELAELLNRLLPRELSPALVVTRNEWPALDSSVARAPAVVREFLSQVPAELAELAQAVLAADDARAQAIAHRLKATCQAFGAGRMARLSATLEELPDGATTLCTALEAEFRIVAQAVQNRRNPSTPASPWNH